MRKLEDDRMVFVVQGEFRVSRDPKEVLSTVLGSCVSVCLWDSEAQLGGMNHFLLPFDNSGGSGQPQRYGIHAMELLINALLKGGARRNNLRAKLFGGAKISANLRDIGSSNIDFARQFLKNEDISCTAESTGGGNARRVIFRPATGQAHQMLVPNAEVPEQSVLKVARQTKPPLDDITLF